jgi:hypothetical protein
MIREFDIEIYGRMLWVATSWEDVKDKFTSYGAYGFEKSEDAYATTYPCIASKKTGKYGVLVVFYDCPKLCGSKIVEHIAHESLHVANAIFDELGIEYSLTHDEHAAYMVGWVAKCCWKVLQKEVYDNINEKI